MRRWHRRDKMAARQETVRSNGLINTVDSGIAKLTCRNDGVIRHAAHIGRGITTRRHASVYRLLGPYGISKRRKQRASRADVAHFY